MVYGGTAGGVMTAVSGARHGLKTLLLEPGQHVGGMATGGLSRTDVGKREVLGGLALEFYYRVGERYQMRRYNVPVAWFYEPRIGESVLREMLAEAGVTVHYGHRLREQTGVLKSGTTIREITTENGARFAAKVFADATYEGDLMARAGVPYRVGREGRDEYGESLAPEQADDQLQAYNFRFMMTRDPENRVAPVPPPGYRREDFVGVLAALESERVQKIFDYPRNCIFKAQTPPLPNGKYDINDVSSGLVRLSLPGKNRAWPNGDPAARAEVFAEHLRDQVGLLYFLQHDEAVPEAFRREAQEWGWCRDEFVETGHLPPQLYVREARRMVGARVFTQRDSEHAPGDARAVLHRDAIAMGDYGNNCHGTAHEGPRFGGKHTGEFYNPVPPYQIPYGTLLPRNLDNLLVPVAASSSHVGFCALRLEPIWMSLGQAAGHAAALAVQDGIAVQDVTVPRLQKRLHAAGSATIYVSDVLPQHHDFAAVQWWGTQGGLHGLEPMPAKPGKRGTKIHGQYYGATPDHAVQLDHPLDAATRGRWNRVFAMENADAFPTRGDWIRAAYRLHTISQETAAH
ncbi:MAG: xanthan lyase [Planctomycetales bacterium 12-60-4]|nr:MAG: xanthan lyase [Planctomycetales bacterium 12-60-4]